MIEPYSNEKHYARLCKWLAAKAIAKPDPLFLSDLGFCVDDCAIGFLFTTNSKICEIDNVAADPSVDSEKRDEALNELFRHLEIKASSLGYELIKGLAEIPTMKARFENLRFRRHGEMTLFYKNIGGRKCHG